MNIFFRVDVSPIIGTGHLSRCLNLAQELKERGAKCTFISRDIEENFVAKIRSLGFELLNLDSNQSSFHEFNLEESKNPYSYWLNVPQVIDARETVEKIKPQNVDWVIIDHYAIDFKWEEIVAPFTNQLLVIDDLANRKHFCDVLLDHNLISEFESRYDNLLKKEAFKLLGPDFTLVHQDFYTLRKKGVRARSKLERVLIYFGGFDNQKLTIKVLKDLEKYFPNKLQIDVVYNGNQEDLASIKSLSLKNNKIAIHSNLESLAPLMLEADLSIGAGGITTWERCAMGLPSLVFTVAENQKLIAKEMHKRNFIAYLGDATEYTEKNLIDTFSKYYNEPELLNAWSHRCMDLVSANGVKFVADLVNLDSNTPVSLRRADSKDENYLLNLRNDPVVRANSTNTELISKSNHKKWYSEILEDISSLLFIAETANNLPIGYFRFQLKDSKWFISYALNNYARNKSLSFKLLEKALAEFFKNFEEVDLYAYCKNNNLASLKILNNSHFNQVSVRRDEILLKYEGKPS